jgi:DNA-directed RNA polymerase subunit L
MIKTLSRDDLDLEFITFDLDTSYINAMRRVLYSDYLGSCFNQEDIAVVENNTLMNNEILRHRISLIPLKSVYNFTCELIIENTTKKIMDVLSNDIKIILGEGTMRKDILIIQLKPGEKINMKMNSTKYGGSKSTTYRPFSICYFKIIKVIYLKKNFKKKIDKYLENYNIYNSDFQYFEKIKDYDIYGYTNNLRDYINPFENILEKDEYIIKDAFYNKKPIYNFNIELFFDEENIIKKTLELLKSQIQEFLNKKKELIPDDNEKKTRLKIEKGTYSILNLLSKEIRNNNNILYSAYDKEHPLDEFIFLEYITIRKDTDYYNIIHTNVNNMLKYIETIQY